MFPCTYRSNIVEVSASVFHGSNIPHQCSMKMPDVLWAMRWSTLLHHWYYHSNLPANDFKLLLLRLLFGHDTSYKPKLSLWLYVIIHERWTQIKKKIYGALRLGAVFLSVVREAKIYVYHKSFPDNKRSHSWQLFRSLTVGKIFGELGMMLCVWMSLSVFVLLSNDLEVLACYRAPENGDQNNIYLHSVTKDAINY